MRSLGPIIAVLLGAILAGHLILFTVALGISNAWSLPSANELVYLVYLEKAWNPELLAWDWTFAGALPGHEVFNLVFGLPTLLLPVEALGWIGRLATWSLALAALLRLGRCFGLGSWHSAGLVLTWLAAGQALVGWDWIIGDFEAKAVAYPLLLWAVAGVLEGRAVPAALLGGLAFTFHTTIGLWGALALGVGYLATTPSPRRVARGAAALLLGALPGAMALASMLRSAVPPKPETWRFLVRVQQPHHLDPFAFPWPHVLAIFLLLTFNGLHAWRHRDDSRFRFLLGFEGALGASFALGLALRGLAGYSLLPLQPIRLAPVLLPLLFFFHAAHAWATAPGRGARGRVAAVVGLALITLGSAHVRLVREIGATYSVSSAGNEPLQQTFAWLAVHTAPDSTVILPPWRKDTFYLARRAQVANWHVARADRLDEWRQRIEALVGDLTPFESEPGAGGSGRRRLFEHMDHAYHRLTESALASIASRYGGEYLVSRTSYSYPVLFQSGAYRVYRLPPVAATSGAGGGVGAAGAPLR